MADQKFGSDTYRIEPMLATKAMKLKFRLVKFLGTGADKFPALIRGAGGKRDGESEADFANREAGSNSAAIEIFTEIFMNNDEGEFIELLTEFIEHAEIKRPDGQYYNVDFDADMTTRMDQIIPVLVWVLKETYGDFFKGFLNLGDLGKALKETMGSAKKK